VDADMRKPRLHHVFSVPGKKGLSHLLAHDRELGLDDLVTPTGIENLFLLPCGVIPSNPVEVLDSARFGELVAEIRSKFDVAIFDSPPGFALVDPIVIGKRVDGLLMVIRSFVTPKAPTQQFAARLQEANVRLLGVVLNNADVPRRSYYYYYGSSYYSGYRYYAKYYEQEGDTTERKKRRAAAA
jgi:capsular exopolysaccharide synthesis family protein